MDKAMVINCINKEMEAIQNIFLILGDIDNCLKKFHGKNFTKRVDTALKAIDKNLKAEIKWNNFNVIYEIKTIYSHNPQVYIISKYMENVNNLQFEDITKLIEEKREYLQKEYSELKQQIKDYDNTIKQVETMQEMISNLNKNIHWSMRQYAGIGYFEYRR